MRKIVCLVMSLLALPATAQPAGPTEVVAIASACESFIRQRMKDPEAARIAPDSLAVRVRGQWYMVVTVNGKNSFGAYEGSREWGCWLDDRLKVQRVVPPG